MTTEITETALYGGERTIEIHGKGDSIFLTRMDGTSATCIEFDRGVFERALIAEGLAL